MKIAMPVADGKLCAHFGHCQVFALFEVDTEDKKIIRREDHTPPMHEPGVLPRWLSEMGVNLILSGGMGARAQQFFRRANLRRLWKKQCWLWCSFPKQTRTGRKWVR